VKRGPGMVWQFFFGMLVVSLGGVLAVGLITRRVFSSAFQTYLSTLPQAQGMGMGRRMILGTAEQTFLRSVDRGVMIGAIIAVLITGVVAFLLARYFTRPLQHLEKGALGVAGGDLSHRVEVSGPAEVVAVADAFNQMADSLEEAEDLRRRLVADVAHELRNPIAAARAQAEGMAEGILPAEPGRLDSLVEDLEHLSSLVDDLQELAIAEAGRLRYEMTDLDIAALVRRETDRVASAAPADLSVLSSGVEEPTFVLGDERRLSQVLRNLLSNALRHTPEGSIEVSLGHSLGQVEVRVTDTGEGIPAEELPYVFERFYRADAARSADTGGAGLGLAITRRIILDHGGKVFAESEPGKGATVGFTLPEVGDDVPGVDH
jgi:signal transduction histidine kinase